MINYSATFSIFNLYPLNKSNTDLQANQFNKMENSNDFTQIGESQKEGVLCLSCMKANDGAAVFCRYCNAALGLTDNPDLLQRIAHEGAVYSKAVEGKPKPIVLIGVWLLFLPVLIISLLSAVSLAFEGERGSISFVFFWVLIISAFFSLTMIYKVTRNYFKGGKKDNL